MTSTKRRLEYVRRLGLPVALALISTSAGASGRLPGAQHAWDRLPPTPMLPSADAAGHVAAGTASLWYGDFGRGHSGTPVLLLHGGLATSRYFGGLIRFLVGHGRRVIAVDTRGHGRSTLGTEPITYDLLSQDVVAVLDRLRIGRADIVGWSDGGITALKTGILHPRRVDRLFLFAAESDGRKYRTDYWQRGAFALYMQRTDAEQAAASARSGAAAAIVKAFANAWSTEPRIPANQLRRITAMTTIADGRHDEVMKLSRQKWLASTIPNARLVVFQNASHFAMLQSPDEFNRAVLASLPTTPEQN